MRLRIISIVVEETGLPGDRVEKRVVLRSAVLTDDLDGEVRESLGTLGDVGDRLGLEYEVLSVRGSSVRVPPPPPPPRRPRVEPSPSRGSAFAAA
eukprot:6992854-Prymnesium_polylepis.1